MSTQQKVFDKYWFNKHQGKLLWLANSFIGKYIFRFKKMGHYIENNIVKITPNSVTELVGIEGGKIEVKEHFFSHNKYAYRLRNILYPIWSTFHYWDIITRPLPQLNLGFDTLTVYTKTYDGTLPTDGNVDGQDVTWSTCRNLSVADNRSYNNEFYLIKAETGYTIIRGVVCMDTSALPDDAVISAAVLSLGALGYGVANADSTSIEIVGATTANPVIIVHEDFDQFGSTSFASMNLSSWNDTDAAYNDFTLDANGRNNISKTGITQYGIRIGRDLFNSAPTGANSFYLRGAKATGSSDPKLVVTYSVVVGPANIKSYNGLAAASVKSINDLAIASVKSFNGLA